MRRRLRAGLRHRHAAHAPVPGDGGIEPGAAGFPAAGGWLSGGWTTHRGDGWWFSDSRVEARGEFNRSPAALQICAVTFRGTPTSEALHDLLWASAQQFP